MKLNYNKSTRTFSDEAERYLHKSVRALLGPLGISVPYAKKVSGKTMITMQIHADKVRDAIKELRKLPTDIKFDYSCADPKDEDKSWYDFYITTK